MKNPGSFLLAILITLCLSFAVPLFIVPDAGASGIPAAPPPTPVNPADVNTSTTTYSPSHTPECTKYKAMTVTYVCGTEEKCYDLGKKSVCVEVEKKCEKIENICVEWKE